MLLQVHLISLASDREEGKCLIMLKNYHLCLCSLFSYGLFSSLMMMIITNKPLSQQFSHRCKYEINCTHEKKWKLGSIPDEDKITNEA